MGVGKGARILKISAKKAVSFVSCGKKQISPLLVLQPRKTFGNIR